MCCNKERWYQTVFIASCICLTHIIYFDLECKAQDGGDSHGDKTIFVISVLSSVIVGVVLGVVGLYLIQRVRGSSSRPTSSSSPPLSPPVTYEEVDVAREVKSSRDIQLTTNEAYGRTLRNNIQTLPDAAYAQVQP